jgi:uncharacterized protein (TIGR00369 family)
MLDAARRQAILDRIAPIPIVETLGFQIESFDEGACRMRVPYDARLVGIYGSYHGGLLMTIADSIACFAIMTVTGPEQAMTTTDMNIRFLAPCFTDVIAEARTIKVGRTLCPVAVDLFDTSGTRVAVAQVTYMRLSDAPTR